MRAEQAEIAVRRGQKPIDADMALRQHGMKYAGHPDGRGQRRLVGNQAAARAQDVTVGPQDAEFLALQRHVAAIARKKRQEAAVFTLRFA